MCFQKCPSALPTTLPESSINPNSWLRGRINLTVHAKMDATGPRHLSDPSILAAEIGAVLVLAVHRPYRLLNHLIRPVRQFFTGPRSLGLKVGCVCRPNHSSGKERDLSTVGSVEGPIGDFLELNTDNIEFETVVNIIFWQCDDLKIDLQITVTEG